MLQELRASDLAHELASLRAANAQLSSAVTSSKHGEAAALAVSQQLQSSLEAAAAAERVEELGEATLGVSELNPEL